MQCTQAVVHLQRSEGTLRGWVAFLFVPCGSQRVNSDHQALPAEPSQQPLKYLLISKQLKMK